MNEELIDKLRTARRLREGLVPAGPAAVHTDVGAALTPRSRLLALLDPGSAVEYGAMAARDANGEWVGETGGVDFVGTINGVPVVTSSTNYADSGGGYGAARLPRLYSLAIERRWPVVQFVDGGGSRARHPRSGLGHVELSTPVGRYTLFDGMAQLSGWAPTVAIVNGPAFAGHASLAGFSDCVIATAGSSIGMGGPPMVEAALGKRLTPHELAGAEMQAECGGIDLLVADQHEAIAAARRYIAYWHDLGDGEPGEAAGAIADLVPETGTYDIRPVIAALADADSVLELRPQFGCAIVTALARFGGRSVGVLASQPLVDDGAIDENAAIKAARLVELCDTYEYPLVSLVDSPGCITRWRGKDGSVSVQPGQTRWHLRCIAAHQQRTVPLVSVRIRRARGLAPGVMCGFGNETGLPLLTLGWPTIETGRRDGFWTTTWADGYDDIVPPDETRKRIVGVLRLVERDERRRDGRKKHCIDTW